MSKDNNNFMAKEMNLPKPEVKPCPFCGGEARMLHNMSKTDYWVECMNCKTCSPGDLNNHTKEEAIAAWNTRVEPQKVAIANVTFTQEQLDEIKEYCLHNLSGYTPVEVVD